MIFTSKDTLVLGDFLTHWPTLKQARRARKARLSAFFREDNVHFPHIIERRIQAILTASALTCDHAVITPNRLLVETLVQELRLLLQAVYRYDREIAALGPTLPDYAVFWRWQCTKFLRQTFVEWAARSIPHCYSAKAYYEQQRSRGSSHQAAVRVLAFKWIRVVYRCWQDRTPYDEATYLTALKQRASPLLN